MKKLMLAIFALSISFTAMSAQERVIEQELLPREAQEFIQTYYSSNKVAIATVEKDGFGREYKVILTDGTKVEFDTKGRWSDVDCKGENVVPGPIIPTYIVQYVEARFSSQKIKGIERGKRGVDVKLDNGIELEFNSKGELIEFEN